jgi:hypothetical protein
MQNSTHSKCSKNTRLVDWLVICDSTWKHRLVNAKFNPFQTFQECTIIQLCTYLVPLSKRRSPNYVDWIVICGSTWKHRLVNALTGHGVCNFFVLYNSLTLLAPWEAQLWLLYLHTWHESSEPVTGTNWEKSLWKKSVLGRLHAQWRSY